MLEDYGAAAIKTGFIGRAELVHAVAERLRFWQASAPERVGPLVVDPVLVNHPGQTDFAAQVASEVAGKDHVDTALAPMMGAEDFSYYAREVPAVFFFVGATPPGQDPATAPSNHSPEFFLDESALDLGLRALLQMSLDYLHGAAGP